MTEEDQIAGRGQCSGVVRVVEPRVHLRFAGDRIYGLERAVKPRGRGHERSADESIPWFHGAALIVTVLLLSGLDRAAALDGRDVHQPELWVVRAGLPVFAAGDRRTQPFADRSCSRAVA